MSALAGSPALVGRLRALTELNLDFVAWESRVFSLERPGALYPLLIEKRAPPPAPPTPLLARELATTATQLVTLLLSLRRVPTIRFQASESKLKHPVARLLAEAVFVRLKAAVHALGDAWEALPGTCTLLILERSFDPITPFMHSFTYQALVHDLFAVQAEVVRFSPGALPVTNNALPVRPSAVVTTPQPAVNSLGLAGPGDGSEEKVLVLAERDPLWLELRHKHLALVARVLTQRFKHFTQTNEMVRLQRETKSLTNSNCEVTQLDALLRAMRDAQAFQQQLPLFLKHLALVEEALQRGDKARVREQAQLQQTLALRSHPDGSGLRDEDAVKALRALCGVGPADLGLMLGSGSGSGEKVACEAKAEPLHVLDKLCCVLLFVLTHGPLESIDRDALWRADPPITAALQRAVLSSTPNISYFRPS